MRPAGPPSAPRNFTAVGSKTGILLSWAPPATNGAGVTYNIYRGGFGKETFLASTSALSYNDASTPAYTYYFYRVAAVNSVGQGPYTPDVGAQRSG